MTTAADREGLREALKSAVALQELLRTVTGWFHDPSKREATLQLPPGCARDAPGKRLEAASAFENASDIAALSETLAQADTAAQAVAATVEDLIVPLARDLAREGGWADPDAPWTDNQAIIARGGACDPVYEEYLDDARSLLGREALTSVLVSHAAALAEVARISAEVEARDKALTVLLPFVDFAAGEGLMFEPDPDDAATRMDAADLCSAAAKALSIEIDGPEYAELVAAGCEAIQALAAGQDKEGGKP